MALSDVITTLSTYCLAVINNSVSGDERIFSLSNFDGFCLLLYLHEYVCCIGTVSNRMRRCIFVNIGLGARIAPLLDVRRRTPGVSSDFCSLSSTKSLTNRFEQLLLCVVGLCEIILNAYFGALAFVHVFPFFFRLRGLLLLIIDYLALLRALLSVLFSRVSVCASESTHQRTNAMAGDSVLRNISLEHLRRGHTPTGGEEIVLDKRTGCGPYFSPTFPAVLRELNRSRDLFYSRAALCSTAILAQAFFFLLQTASPAARPLEHST